MCLKAPSLPWSLVPDCVLCRLCTLLCLFSVCGVWLHTHPLCPTARLVSPSRCMWSRPCTPKAPQQVAACRWVQGGRAKEGPLLHTTAHQGCSLGGSTHTMWANSCSRHLAPDVVPTVLCFGRVQCAVPCVITQPGRPATHCTHTLYSHTVLTHCVPMLLSPPPPPHTHTTPPQGILHFQHLTRKMMYRLVADALEAEGITTAQPKDYLHFFCLGKREPMTPVSEPCLAVWQQPHTCVCGGGAVGLCGVCCRQSASALQGWHWRGRGVALHTHTQTHTRAQHGPNPQAGRASHGGPHCHCRHCCAALFPCVLLCLFRRRRQQ